MKVAVYQEFNDNGLFFMKNGSDSRIKAHFLGFFELAEYPEDVKKGRVSEKNDHDIDWAKYVTTLKPQMHDRLIVSTFENNVKESYVRLRYNDVYQNIPFGSSRSAVISLLRSFIDNLNEKPADVKKDWVGEGKRVPDTVFFSNFKVGMVTDIEVYEAKEKGELFHKDEFFEYYRYNGKIYVAGAGETRGKTLSPDERDKIGLPTKLVTKEAIKAYVQPNYAGGVNYITYEFPICALDIVPPSYKIKE